MSLKKLIQSTALYFALLSLFTPLSRAEDPPQTPETEGSSYAAVLPCIGYDPNSDHWGTLDVSPSFQAECPKGQAILYHLAIVGREVPPEQNGLHGTCCPLPPGVLSQESFYSATACPGESVVTGAHALPLTKENPVAHFELRCTKINSDVARLAPPRPAIPLEFGRQRKLLGWLFPYDDEFITSRDLLPANLRYGVGRVSRTQWSRSGCVGYPWGSALTKLGGRACESFEFRQIILRKKHSGVQSSTNEANGHSQKGPCTLLKLTDPLGTCVFTDAEKQ